MELSIFTIVRRIFTKRDKKVIGILLLASILVSIVETVSISALMVFISIATNFNVAFSNRYFNKLYSLLGCSKPADLVIMLGLGLLAFYCVRFVLNVLHIYYMNKFAQMRQHYFSTRLFQRYLQFSYKDLVAKNSTSISQVIFAYTSNATQIIAAFLSMSSEIFTVVCVYAMLFYVNWKMTLVLTGMLILKVGFIIKMFTKRIIHAGKQSQFYSAKSSKIFSESFWNFKFLKLISYDKPIRDRFNDARLHLAQANTVNAVWQGLPRYILETIGFSILIAIVIYVVFMYNTASFVIPMVSMYALAFYRFLPSVNKIVTGYNQIMFNKHVLKPLYEFLEHDYEQLGHEKITFKESIEFKDVSFAYNKKAEVLQKVNITIKKGLRVGFIGESGAGKSTIADLFMGFFKSQGGQILIDGVPLSNENVKSWRQKIGYIPQSIFLFNGTVADNVACGRNFDEAMVIDAFKRARIYNFLQTKDGIDTIIGEGGINVSGGQKQRIAIARALYGNPDILVLDEATSALDNETEEEIMNEIYSNTKDKTLIIIAHRLTTIERCDVVYKIEGAQVYQTVLGHVGQQPAFEIHSL